MHTTPRPSDRTPAGRKAPREQISRPIGPVQATMRAGTDPGSSGRQLRRSFGAGLAVQPVVASWLRWCSSAQKSSRTQACRRLRLASTILLSPGGAIQATCHPAKHRTCHAAAQEALRFGAERIQQQMVRKSRFGHLYICATYHDGFSASKNSIAASAPRAKSNCRMVQSRVIFVPSFG